MKKFIIAMIAAACSLPSFSQGGFLETLNSHNIFNHVSVSAHAATTGFGFELASPITDFVEMRVGGTFMPGFSFNTDVDGEYTAAGVTKDFTMDLEASLARSQGSLIFNIYPFARRNAFFVAAGAYFGGSDIIKVKGHSDEIAREIAANESYIQIGDYELPVDKNGNVSGGLKVNSFRPYLGIGYGREIPKKRLSFMFELGVQFHGHMKLYSNNGDIEDLTGELDNDDDWQKWMDKLTVYPVLKFTLAGRIF